MFQKKMQRTNALIKIVKQERDFKKILWINIKQNAVYKLTKSNRIEKIWKDEYSAIHRTRLTRQEFKDE